MRKKYFMSTAGAFGWIASIGFIGMLALLPTHATPTAATKETSLQISADGTKFEQGVQALDGLDCRECIFQDVMLTYAGGPVHLIKPRFVGNVTIELKGAAKNTRDLLQFVDVVTTATTPATNHFEVNMTSKMVVAKTKRSADLILNASNR